MAENNIVYQARLHFIIFFWPVALLLVGVYLGLEFRALRDVATFFIVFSIVWVIMVWLTYHFSSLIIKSNQVILCSGILVRKTLDIPLSKVESIDIRQSILGSLLQYGSLIITGTGGSRQFINNIAKPLTCRRYIEQLMHG